MSSLLTWNKSSSKSLFERIKRDNYRINYKKNNIDYNALATSIIENLDKILNTHPGSCQSAKELGIMDLNDANSGIVDVCSRVQLVIKKCILNYEPRIVDVNITWKIDEDDPCTMFFYLEAVVKLNSNFYQKILFNLKLDSDEYYKVGFYSL